VLAHSSILTAQKHYIHAGSIEAGKGLMRVMKQLKSNLPVQQQYKTVKNRTQTDVEL
jgi:hypothetical protein